MNIFGPTQFGLCAYREVYTNAESKYSLSLNVDPFFQDLCSHMAKFINIDPFISCFITVGSVASDEYNGLHNCVSKNNYFRLACMYTTYTFTHPHKVHTM